MSPLRPRSRPQPAPSLIDLLDRIVPMFDELVRDARLGHPLSHRAFDELEARAQGIANLTVAAFRGTAGGTTSAAPKFQRGGRAGW